MKAKIYIENKLFDIFPILIKGDLGYNIKFNLENENGTIYPIPLAAEVYVSGRHISLNQSFSKKCVVENYTSGIVNYTLEQADFNYTGLYGMQLQVSSPTLTLTTNLSNLVIGERL